MSRAFLDANVLFSAAYREKSGLTRLWDRPGVELVTSAYAAEEARRNLMSPDQRARLESLLSRMRIVAESDAADACQRQAAGQRPSHPESRHRGGSDPSHHRATSRTFGRYFGTRIAGVLVVTPADFLRG